MDNMVAALASRYKQSHSAGFTLVETLVALVLLMTFFASIATIFQIVTSIVGESRVRTVATNLASEKIEIVRNLPYTDVGTEGGIPNGVLQQTETASVNGQDFEVKTTIIYIDDEFDGENLWKIRLDGRVYVNNKYRVEDGG